MIRSNLLLVLALSIAVSQYAGAANPTADLRALLIQALDSPDGRASGAVTGNSAEFLRRAFRTHAPIVADVSVLHPLPQEGCKRLNVRYSISGAALKFGESEPRPFHLDIGINYCRDGSAPAGSARTLEMAR